MSLILPPWYRGPAGRILIPGDRGSRVDSPGTREVRIPIPEVPPQLREDLDMNERLLPKFKEAVGKALSMALADPETAPRELTEHLLKELAEKCYKVILIMRYEMGFALTRCFDILPDEFLASLKAGERTEDMVEAHQNGMWWKRSGAQPENMVMKPGPTEANLTETAREELHQAKESGDALYQEVHGKAADDD